MCRRLGAAALVLASAACGPPAAPEQPAARGVVLVSTVGRPATATPAGAVTRVPPTPTLAFDPKGLAATDDGGRTVEPPATPTPAPRPTRPPPPELEPYPTVERPPRLGPFVQPVATSTPRPPTPAPPPRPRAPRPEPPPERADPAERAQRNDTLATAAEIAPGKNVPGLISGAGDVDVYSIAVGEEDAVLVVTLEGEDADLYRVVLISPGQLSPAAATRTSATARRVRYPVRSATGVWFVEVAPSGRRLPRDGYTLRVEVLPAPKPPAGADEE